MSFAGKRVLVVGLGVSGHAAARVLASLDAKVRVTEASDSPEVRERAEELSAAGVEVEVGGHDLERLDADLAVVSPGIKPSAEVMVALASRRIEVIGEVELAARLASCDFIGVTGTNGKTTTTTLLASMLTESGYECIAAGNIGKPLVEAALESSPDGVIAAELSSFQLATIDTFRPNIAVVLNVAEDHTDWHGTFAAYRDDKARITENQLPEDVLVPNLEDPVAMSIAEGSRARIVPFSYVTAPEDGIGCASGEILWRGTTLLDASEILLPGDAGVEDVCAAAGAALSYEADPDAVVRAVKRFRGLPHRLETIAEIEGVAYIDDSKATNPHATLAAVGGLTDVVLIAGGRNKGMDLHQLTQTVPPVIGVVALGEAAADIEHVFSGLVPTRIATSMHEAVVLAHALARRGGSVLLSPGCASLDMYKNYEERGDDFAREVRRIDGDEE